MIAYGALRCVEAIVELNNNDNLGQCLSDIEHFEEQEDKRVREGTSPFGEHRPPGE